MPFALVLNEANGFGGIDDIPFGEPPSIKKKVSYSQSEWVMKRPPSEKFSEQLIAKTKNPMVGKTFVRINEKKRAWLGFLGA